MFNSLGAFFFSSTRHADRMRNVQKKFAQDLPRVRVCVCVGAVCVLNICSPCGLEIIAFMITIALARASRCCLLARLQGAPHNTAYACSRPSLEVKQLFICLILWVAENVISLYICTQILTICAAVRATNQSEVNENFT